MHLLPYIAKRFFVGLVCLACAVGPAWAEKPPQDSMARAAVLAETGWKLVKGGAYHKAEQIFSEAAALAPADAAPLIGLGVSRHLLVRDEQAEAAFRKALALDPGSAQAHKFLGDIYDQRGESGAALQHYEAAVRRDPADSGIRGRVEAARRAAEAEAGLDRIFSAHFVVKFHRSTDRVVANTVADRLETIAATAGKQWAYVPSSRVVVVLYPSRQFAHAEGPEWAQGLFDGRIHLPAERVSGTDADAVLRHEYTHAVVHRLSGGQAPAWLNEGLALYMERGPEAVGTWEREASRIRSGERPPLAALHRGFLELAPADASLAYAESYGATRALIKRHGLAPVRRLLESLSVTPEFSEAFETVFRERYSDFDAAWVAADAGARF
jgi:tetratricopeptide (TPR) repeat protein